MFVCVRDEAKCVRGCVLKSIAPITATAPLTSYGIVICLSIIYNIIILLYNYNIIMLLNDIWLSFRFT